MNKDDVSTLAGNLEGFQDGKGELAKFYCPTDVCFNPRDECLYVCDFGNSAIRKITLEGNFPFSLSPPPPARFFIT